MESPSGLALFGSIGKEGCPDVLQKFIAEGEGLVGNRPRHHRQLPIRFSGTVDLENSGKRTSEHHGKQELLETSETKAVWNPKEVNSDKGLQQL